MIPVIDAKAITSTNIIYKYKVAEMATEYLVSKKQYIRFFSGIKYCYLWLSIRIYGL